MKKKDSGKPISPIYTVGLIWLAYSLLIHPISTIGRLISVGALSLLGYGVVKAITSRRRGQEKEAEPEVKQAERTVHTVEVPRTAGAETVARQKAEQQRKAEQEAEERRRREAEQAKNADPPKPRYTPEVQAIIDEGVKADAELERLYRSIPDISVKRKVARLRDIAAKIVADATEDPSDVPQIKKFLDYYLPTTIKLLNTYDRMGAQGVRGANISNSMSNIEEMLDSVIKSYEKLLDSLFANQALDVETDIQVMNTLLQREGFNSGGSAFQTQAK